MLKNIYKFNKYALLLEYFLSKRSEAVNFFLSSSLFESESFVKAAATLPISLHFSLNCSFFLIINP